MVAAARLDPLRRRPLPRLRARRGGGLATHRRRRQRALGRLVWLPAGDRRSEPGGGAPRAARCSPLRPPLVRRPRRCFAAAGGGRRRATRRWRVLLALRCGAAASAGGDADAVGGAGGAGEAQAGAGSSGRECAHVDEQKKQVASRGRRGAGWRDVPSPLSARMTAARRQSSSRRRGEGLLPASGPLTTARGRLRQRPSAHRRRATSVLRCDASLSCRCRCPGSPCSD
mmetsp:Transcript_9381/g.27460  ORF Transcript_9381/g.27460 Transcript_9381/m.27460 type:complete len:228 (-) Transcript_9381:561-1244(-)